MEAAKLKSQMRSDLIEHRSAMDYSDWMENTSIIQSTLKELDWLVTAKCIHVFISMNERREVGTHQLISDLLQTDKRLVVPVMNFDNGGLNHLYLNDLNHLKMNKWGVFEPKNGEEADLDHIDLVIIPMVGGDLKKNRLGYGKGYYDRFLSEIKAKKVGLCFEAGIVDSIPAEDFDIPLDAIITEKRVIY